MILITGIDGYIGSHMAQRLSALRIPYWGIDLDFSKNNIVCDIKYNVNLCYWEELNTCVLEQFIFEKGFADKIQATTHIFHFAGWKSIKHSLINPLKTISNNVNSTINLLNFAENYFPKAKIIFSSSASVYGNAQSPIREDSPLNPLNPYALSKKICEDIIMNSGINYAILRYFNPVGELYKLRDHSTDSINYNIRKGDFQIFGNDYPTSDGTPVRDFIPISELIDAHLEAMKWKTNEIVNIGTGSPTTVKQLLDKIQIPYTIGPRREGDVAELWADISKYRNLLIRYREAPDSSILKNFPNDNS